MIERNVTLPVSGPAALTRPTCLRSREMGTLGSPAGRPRALSPGSGPSAVPPWHTGPHRGTGAALRRASHRPTERSGPRGTEGTRSGYGSTERHIRLFGSVQRSPDEGGMDAVRMPQDICSARPAGDSQQSPASSGGEARGQQRSLLCGDSDST